MLIRNLGLIILIIICHLNFFGQTDESVNYQADTAKVNKYIEIVGDIVFIYPDSAMKYCDSILSLSKIIQFKHGLFIGYNMKGNIFWVLNDMDQALDYYKLALKYVSSTKDPRSKAVVLSNIGLVFSNKHMLDSAIYYLGQTIQYAEDHNVDDIHAKAIFDLGNLHLDVDNYVEAIRYLMEVKDILEINNDSVLLMHVYSAFGILYSKVNQFELSLYNYNNAINLDHDLSKVNIEANNYINIGQLFFDNGKNLDSALYYYRKANSVALPHNKRIVELSTNINVGNVFLYKMQYDSAIIYYRKALNDSIIFQLPVNLAAVTVNIGLYYYFKKEFNSSRHYLESGYTMSNKLGILRYEKNALEALASLDSITGNYKGSLNYYREFHKVSDSIQVLEANSKIAILEFEKYLSQQKNNNEILIKESELKNELINNQQKLLWGTILVIILLLIGSYILFLNRKEIQKLYNELALKKNALSITNEELEVTNETLNSQKEQLKELNLAKDKFFSILGHDLKSPFNSLLGMLQLMDEDWNLINDDEKKGHIHNLYLSSKKTYELLEDLLLWGRAQRGLLEYKPEKFNIYDNVIPIVDLFQSQFNQKKQSVTIDISKELVIKTDPRYFIQILQNLVNNAIKFTSKAGMITITAIEDDKKISICIVDTG
ncbi:MAG: hypothetical protein HQ521_09805, partial [Bacteroidetes bacterium]|nr:hypothetical protein [Bacteroidota bacterium]